MSLRRSRAWARHARSGGAIDSDLTIDDGSAQCATAVCLVHYFQGRVDCPYGNGNVGGQTGTCTEVPGRPHLYTLDGTAAGTICCPQPGGGGTPIALPVEGQCSGRGAKDAVYCSCRCDVPDDPAIDRSKIHLCTCADGFACVPLCDAKHGNCGIVPKSKWGSYCVKVGPLGADYDPNDGEAICGGPLRP
jgi:hypothetical protein